MTSRRNSARCRAARTIRSTASRRLGVLVPLALAAGSLTLSTTAATAVPLAPAPAVGPASLAGPVPTWAADNPLAGRRWGVYKGRTEQSWQPYADSTGDDRALLGKIALRPKSAWFGKWTSSADITAKVRAYVAGSTHGDPDTLVQLAVFRMSPWEHDACSRLPTVDEQAAYKHWTNRFAAGIGSAHVALVLQPDGPFALCAPGGSKLPSHLIRYAARTFSALPHTSVYIDAGASDWPSDKPGLAASILMPAGIRYARGFALNSTHYSSTAANIEFGSQVVAELARRGVAGKHFVVNTSSNGQPFTFNHAKGTNPDNADVCRSLLETGCVTLGIPPTWRVARPRWGLAGPDRVLARAHVDGYLWFGRPWLHNQASPFVTDRALGLARTTPF